MRKPLMWFPAMALLLIGLVACQAKTPDATASQPSPQFATVTPQPTATPVPSTPTPVPVAQATSTPQPKDEPMSTAEAGTRPTPTQAWQIPTIGSGDWGKGNPDAGVVLVEYSDFQ